jgi:hypothetical protein
MPGDVLSGALIEIARFAREAGDRRELIEAAICPVRAHWRVATFLTRSGRRSRPAPPQRPPMPPAGSLRSIGRQSRRGSKLSNHLRS